MRETRAEKNYILKESFRRWIKAMYYQFMDNHEAIVYSGHKNCTYVYLRSKVGVAKCNPTDTWNKEIGIAYAWARCTGQPVYYEKEEKYTPHAGDWVNVNTTNRGTGTFRYICEGIDNYCFKTRGGRLMLIDKDRIIAIGPAK